MKQKNEGGAENNLGFRAREESLSLIDNGGEEERKEMVT